MSLTSQTLPRAQAGMDVSSYGVGNNVKLPGSSLDSPNVYPFGTPYEEIFRDLSSKDKELYTRNGLLKMLERNISIKKAPQKWQLERKEMFDVAVTFEKWVFDKARAGTRRCRPGSRHPWPGRAGQGCATSVVDDRRPLFPLLQLVEDMNTRPQTAMKSLLVVNIDVKDNAEEAATMGPQVSLVPAISALLLPL